MRIALVSETYSLFGGGEVYLSRLQSLLKRKGHQVKWWAPSSKSLSYIDEILALWNPVYQLKLEKFIARFDPDIVHFHGFIHRLSGSVIFNTFKKKKVVLTLHDFNLFCPKITLLRNQRRLCSTIFPSNYCFQRCLLNGLYKNLIRYPRLFINQYIVRNYVSVLIAPSTMLLSLALRAFPNVPCLHLPNFLPTYPMIQSIQKRQQNLFVFIGRLHSTKGLIYAIRAIHNLKQEGINVLLKIAGTGPQEGELRDLVKRLYLQDRIAFMGHIDRQEVLSLMEHSCAILVPSLWAENSPLVVYEALATNTPVIASRIGGLPDLVDNGKTGYLIPPGDISALADRIKLMLRLDVDARHRMSHAIYQKALKYSEEIHYSNLINIYEIALKLHSKNMAAA